MSGRTPEKTTGERATGLARSRQATGLAAAARTRPLRQTKPAARQFPHIIDEACAQEQACLNIFLTPIEACIYAQLTKYRQELADFVGVAQTWIYPDGTRVMLYIEK